jgi:hypothetical protein
MNTINQAIPTAFAEETAFALALKTSNPIEKLEQRVLRMTFDDSPLLDQHRRGIPESALND